MMNYYRLTVASPQPASFRKPSSATMLGRSRLKGPNRGEVNMFTGVHPLLRRLHIWIGLLMLVPIIIVSITAILLAHDRDLGLKGMMIQADWLPAAWIKQEHKSEVKAYLAGGEGTALIGTKSGLYYLESGPEGSKLTAIPELQGMDIRALRRWQDGVLVAARQGVFLSMHGRWQQLYKGDAHAVDTDEDGNLYVAAHHQGLIISRDGGQSWQADKAIGSQLAKLADSEPAHGMELKKLIKDMHTGGLLVGKGNERNWIDIISGLLLFMSLIGVYRWWKKRNIY